MEQFTTRQNKIGRLIQKELSEFFRRDAQTYAPGKMISVTAVRVTRDMSLAYSFGIAAAMPNARQTVDRFHVMQLLAVATEAAPALFDALVAAGAVRAGTAAWQLGMIRAGLPLITAPTQEEFVAQMLNYELIGGVDFHKGCYPGQEIVARTQYLGKLKKRTYRLALPAGSTAAPGTDVYAPDFGEQSAGKLVNVAPTADGGVEALAVIQSSSAEAGDIRVGAPDGPRASLLDLPYALG